MKEWLSKKYWYLFFVIFAFVLLGTKAGVFTLAALVLSLVSLFLLPSETYLLLLFFLLPFASIFKILSLTDMSFFTVLEFAYILFYLRQKKITHGEVLALLLMNLIVLLPGNQNLLSVIKLVLGLALLYFSFSENVNAKQVIIALSLGICISSTISLFFYEFFNINAYVKIVFSGGINERIFRFTGLFTDPNYYSVNVILCILGLYILKARRELKMEFYPLVILLIFFGAISASKTFLTMLIVCSVLFLIFLARRKRYGLLVFIAAILIFGSVMIFRGTDNIFTVTLSRFNFATVDTLTTGRGTLWRLYTDYVFENCLFFGEGISAPLFYEKGMHNTYLDFLYYMGLFRSLLFLATAFYAFWLNRTKTKKDILCFAPLLVILVMYFSLSELYMPEVPFHLCIAFLFIKLGATEHEAEQN